MQRHLVQRKRFCLLSNLLPSSTILRSLQRVRSFVNHQRLYRRDSLQYQTEGVLLWVYAVLASPPLTVSLLPVCCNLDLVCASFTVLDSPLETPWSITAKAVLLLQAALQRLQKRVKKELYLPSCPPQKQEQRSLCCSTYQSQLPRRVTTR